MSLGKRIVFGVGVSWFSRVVTISANLFLIPLMFRYLGKEELGLWFLLSGSQGMLGLLGMGVAPIISRRIALAKGKSGVQAEVQLTDESKQEIGDLTNIANTLLKIIGLLAFLISSIVGYFFIDKLVIVEVSRQTVILSWIILCAGYSIGVWVEYLNCLLMGFGYVGFNNLILTFMSLGTTVINIVVVILGGGLLELSIVLVITNLIQRFLLVIFIRKYKPHLLKFKGQWNTDTAKSLVKPSLDYWFKSLGTYTILRSDQYFIGTLIGVSAIASYNATYQLVSNLRTIAVALSQSSIPFISQMWESGDIAYVHKIVKKVCLSALLIVSIGSSFLLVSGRNFIELWIGKDSFIGHGILIVFCIMIFFDTQNACLIECARATGKDKYGLMSMIAGFLNIILTFILIKPLGLLGVCLATLISLMLTENWYALYEPLARLKITLGEYVKKIILPIIGIFILSYTISFLINLSLSLSSWNSQRLSIVLTILSNVLVFLFMSYQLVLDKAQKNTIFGR
jgi:O-antigen/teichoic acid export membrane protein